MATFEAHWALGACTVVLLQTHRTGESRYLLVVGGGGLCRQTWPAHCKHHRSDSVYIILSEINFHLFCTKPNTVQNVVSQSILKSNTHHMQNPKHKAYAHTEISCILVPEEQNQLHMH